MKESITLRALDNIMSINTIYAFMFGISFLIFLTLSSRILDRWKLKKWFFIFLSGWIASFLVFTSYFVIAFLIEVISSFRFGTNIKLASLLPHLFINFRNIENFWWAIFIIQLLISIIASIFTAIIYLIHYWINNKIIIELFKVKLLPITSAFTIFISLNIFQGIILIFLPKMNISSIFLNLSIWIPFSVGIALAFLAYEYYLYFDRFKTQEKELQIANLQKQVSQSQLNALSSKINPHFLYNSLNSIAGLSTEDSTKTREMAVALSKLFRYNINMDDSIYVKISKEIEMVLLYLKIEKIRFENRLIYNLDIEDSVRDQFIPRHFLQPLVENAVKHGSTETGVKVTIAIKKMDKGIKIEILDSGKAFDSHFDPGYGLKYLYDKLDILAKDKYEISFLNDPKMVQIKIYELIKHDK